MPRRRYSLTLALLLLAGGAGCGVVRRVSECQEVVETVNSGLSTLHVEVPDAGTSPEAYQQIADAYEALGQRLDALAPTDPELADALASYRDLIDRAARHSREYAAALGTVARSKKKRNDRQAQLSRVRAQAKTQLVREAAVVRKLNTVCHQ